MADQRPDGITPVLALEARLPTGSGPGFLRGRRSLYGARGAGPNWALPGGSPPGVGSLVRYAHSGSHPPSQKQSSRDTNNIQGRMGGDRATLGGPPTGPTSGLLPAGPVGGPPSACGGRFPPWGPSDTQWKGPASRHVPGVQTRVAQRVGASGNIDHLRLRQHAPREAPTRSAGARRSAKPACND